MDARLKLASQLAVEETRLPRGLLRAPLEGTQHHDTVSLADAYESPVPPSRSPSVTANMEISDYQLNLLP